MIPNFKTYLKESIWSDMQERGTGDLLKKEDDVNLMDQYQFAEYLSGRYKIKSKINSSGINYLKSENELIVPILSKGTGWNSLLTMECGRKKGVCFGRDVDEDFPEFYQQMNDNFILNKEKRKRFTSWYIYPKDGSKINNSFFVTVLDFIISTGDKCLIISKNLRESIWSDMQERGTGDIEKKEDSVNLMGVEKFSDYLSKRYSFKDDCKIEYDKKISMVSIPGLCTDGIFGHDNVGVDYEKGSSRIQFMWILDSALPGSVRSALKKRFELSSGNSYTFLSPLDGGKPTNQFVVDVLDYMADLNMDEINIIKVVKESIWSDMQDRGTGDMEKIEDNVDRIYDLKKLYEYIQKRYDPEKRFSSLSSSELTLSIGIDYFTEYGAKDLSVKLYWWKNEKVLNISCTKPVLEELSKKYDIADGGRQLKQRGDDLKNSTIIGVIDTILEVIPKHKQMEAFIK